MVIYTRVILGFFFPSKIYRKVEAVNTGGYVIPFFDHTL